MSEILRSQFPSLKNKIYFNYGGQGPLPKPALDNIVKSWETIQKIGPFTNNVWDFIGKEIISTKQLLSKILGVNPKNIALSENISTGMVLPLWGIKLEPDDELIISDCEHPGIVAACREFTKRSNSKLTIFPIQKINELNDNTFISEISKYLNSNTKVIVISHVLWNFGYTIPIKKLKEKLNYLGNDPYLIVDGAQSFAHINIKEDVSKSDIYAITSHKWACGPEGLGAIFISDRFIKETSPTIIGWKSLKREQGIYEQFNDLYHEDARKFEIATSCIPLLAGFRTSLKILKTEILSEERNEILKSMSNYLWCELNKLEDIDLVLQAPLSNGIVSFNIEKMTNKNSLIKNLGNKEIWIRLIEDPKWFRVCIHQLTTFEEIELLLDELKLLI